MKTYYVTVNFRKSPACTWEGQAPDEQSAKFFALKWAQSCGFDGEVKSYKVRAV